MRPTRTKNTTRDLKPKCFNRLTCGFGARNPLNLAQVDPKRPLPERGFYSFFDSCSVNTKRFGLTMLNRPQGSPTLSWENKWALQCRRTSAHAHAVLSARIVPISVRPSPTRPSSFHSVIVSSRTVRGAKFALPSSMASRLIMLAVCFRLKIAIASA